MLEVISIGSSSSGNSYIIRSDRTAILLDLGLPARTIRAAIAELGLVEDDIKAILITHEHTDHIKSVRAIAKACPNSIFYTSKGTFDGCPAFQYVDNERINLVIAGTEIEVEDLRVRSFALSHDAKEPLGFSVECDNDCLTVVTDTGTVTAEIRHELERANKLIFEANHEENMLMMGPYPYNLKRRILSDYGHLSNDTTARILKELVQRNHEYGERPMEIMLAHLSSTNNTPHNARAVIIDELRQAGYEQERDYRMTVAAKEGLTRL